MIENIKLYKEALKKKGLISQLDIFIEESSEAIQSVIKFKRNEGLYEEIVLKDNVAEELADTVIMVEQLLISLNIEKQFNEFKNKKIERLKQRLTLLKKEK